VSDDIPRVPDHCLDPNCRDLSVVAIAIVDDKGKRRSGSISDFAYQTHEGWTLFDGITFVRWETRCASCYDRDMRNHQRCSNPFNPFNSTPARK